MPFMRTKVGEPEYKYVTTSGAVATVTVKK